MLQLSTIAISVAVTTVITLANTRTVLLLPLLLQLLELVLLAMLTVSAFIVADMSLTMVMIVMEGNVRIKMKLQEF